MAFNIDSWKDRIKQRFQNWQPRTTKLAVDSLYVTLAAAALWPVAQAYHQGEILAVMAMGQLLAGVGGNLLANVVQQVKDEADTAVQLQGVIAEKPAVIQELDTLLEGLDVLQQVQAELAQEDRIWFLETLQAELKALGNLNHFEATLAEGSALAYGDHAIAAAAGAVVVNGDVNGNINTGNTYIGVQNVMQNNEEAERLEKIRQRYLKRLGQQCNVLPLAAMGGDEGVHEEIGLDDVYIALDTQSRVPLEEEEKEKRKKESFSPRGEEDRVVTALEAATQERQLVLLGEPGGGKTTFVRQLVAKLAAVELGQPALPGWTPVMPILTTLRALGQHLSDVTLEEEPTPAQTQALLNAMRDQWREDLTALGAAALMEPLEDWLVDGKAILILDGLDEVADSMRGRIRAVVKAVRDEYGKDLRIIVTCRIRSYMGDAVLPGFATETLAPFSPEKIQTFIQGWYQAQVAMKRMTPAEAEDKAKDLSQAAVSDDLRDLAANPMLLTTMAIIHQREVGLPKERVRLYSLAVQVLLRRWQMRKGMAVSDDLAAILDNSQRIREILNRLGYEAHKLQEQQGAGSDLARRDILALLEDAEYLGDMGLAAEFLDYVDHRAGLLVGHGGSEVGQKPPTYSFPHRTFQEYLAGCWMVTGRKPARTYREHMKSSDYWYLPAELGSEELLYNNPQGRTLFLDLAYDLCPVTEPDGAANWRGVVWSGRMATLLPQPVIAADDDPDGGQAYLDRLLPRLVQVIGCSELPGGERAAAGRSLARWGDTRAQVMDVDQMPLGYIPPGSFLMGSSDTDKDARDNEKPQHEFNIDYGYWLAKYPVTNAQFTTFVEDGGYGNSAYWPEAAKVGNWQDGQFKGRWDDDPRSAPYNFGEPFSLGNHPVVGISWYEAIAFCRWLTQRWQGNVLLPKDWQVILPSEAEWEKGARGGLTVPEQALVKQVGEISRWEPNVTLVNNLCPNRVYPWGNGDEADQVDPNLANFESSGIGSSSAVGCFPNGISPYGLEEMAGNVFDWTCSREKSYPYVVDDGRELFQSDNDRFIVRGGYFGDDSSWVRCAFRYGVIPFIGSYNFGFRVVCVPISHSGR